VLSPHEQALTKNWSGEIGSSIPQEIITSLSIRENLEFLLRESEKDKANGGSGLIISGGTDAEGNIAIRMPIEFVHSRLARTVETIKSQIGSDNPQKSK